MLINDDQHWSKSGHRSKIPTIIADCRWLTLIALGINSTFCIGIGRHRSVLGNDPGSPVKWEVIILMDLMEVTSPWNMQSTIQEYGIISLGSYMGRTGTYHMMLMIRVWHYFLVKNIFTIFPFILVVLHCYTLFYTVIDQFWLFYTACYQNSRIV